MSSSDSSPSPASLEVCYVALAWTGLMPALMIPLGGLGQRPAGLQGSALFSARLGQLSLGRKQARPCA